MPALPLTPGATYWLEIINSAGDPNNYWSWVNAALDGTHASDVSTGWYLNDNDLAFRLTDDGHNSVPEPASLTLLGLGLAGTAFRRRFRLKTS